MPHLRGRVLPVTLAAVVLVGGANLAAYAANGHPLLLGGSNNETKTATVTNTGKGPALSLKTSRKSPPLAVNSSKVVAHLNADSVDGKGASALTTNVITYTVPPGTALPFALKLNGLPKGNYIAMVAVVMHAGANPSVCYLSDNTPPYDLLGYGVNTSFGYTAVDLTGLVTVRAGHPMFLNCNSATTVDQASDAHSQVSFTPVGKVSLKTGTLTARSPQHRGAAGR
jgi:hypothetical protein